MKNAGDCPSIIDTPCSGLVLGRCGSSAPKPHPKAKTDRSLRRLPLWVWTDQFMRNMDGNVLRRGARIFAASPGQVMKTFVQ
jgi:hypothetical protein